MNLLYGTTNKSKIEFMQACVAPLGINILSLADVSAPKLYIEENGNSPLENACIKARAYYNALKTPLFSCDSGLYIDGLPESRQPGINVRGPGDHMTDADATAYYAALAAEMGGKMVARYVHAICFIDRNGTVHQHMGKDIASAPFYMVDTPHAIRKEGFPLDSLSVHMASGKYYYDLADGQYYDDIGSGGSGNNGFAAFFSRALYGNNSQ